MGTSQIQSLGVPIHKQRVIRRLRLPEHSLNTRNQCRRLYFECAGELAQSRKRRLTYAAFDLTDERAIDVCFQRQCLLRHASYLALLA
jgi:hypothetical protein